MSNHQPLSQKVSLSGNAGTYYTPRRSPSLNFLTNNNHSVSQINNSQLLQPNLGNEFHKELDDLQRKYQNETEQMKRDYQMNFDRHLKLGRNIQDLEGQLDDEKRSYLLLEDKFNTLIKELDAERRYRIDLEHDNAGYKEELRRKENLLKDLDANLAKFQQDNIHLNSEVNTLRSEIARLDDVYGMKVTDLEERHLIEVRELNNQIEKVRAMMEEQMKEYNSKTRELNRDWEQKLYRSEDSLRDCERRNSELSAEVRAQTEHNQRLKTDLEDEMRRQSNFAREDEKTRWGLVIKDLEAEIRQLADEKEIINRKQQDSIRDITMRDRRLHEVQLNHESELQRINSENNDLRNQINIIRSESDKHRNDVQNKEAIINRLESEILTQAREIDRVKEGQQHEINRLKTDHDADLRRFHDLERDLRNKNIDTERHLKLTEDDLSRLRVEYDRMRDELTGNIQKIISQTFVESDVRQSTRRNNL